MNSFHLFSYELAQKLGFILQNSIILLTNEGGGSIFKEHVVKLFLFLSFQLFAADSILQNSVDNQLWTPNGIGLTSNHPIADL